MSRITESWDALRRAGGYNKQVKIFNGYIRDLGPQQGEQGLTVMKRQRDGYRRSRKESLLAAGRILFLGR